MAVETDLGCAKLESKPNGVQLTLKSSAQFAASGEDEVDLKRILTEHILNQNSGSRLWIHGGSGFKLVISLQIDGDPTEQLLDEAAETFAARLRSPKWWPQFHLSPSAIRVMSTSDQVRQIEVFLRHEDFAIDQSKRQFHKLDTGVPFHDVKPPPGIRQIALSEVRLTMTAKKQRSSKRRRTTKRLSSQMPSAIPILSPPALGNERTPPSHASTGASDFNVLQLDPSEDASCLQDCRDHEWLMESDDESSLQSDATMLFGDDDANAPKLTETLLLPLPPSKRACDDDDFRANDEDTSIDMSSDTILVMIDTALRLAISGSPISRLESTVIKQDKSIRPLARIAPTMWSPVYLPAVASRAPFSPTICHAFSTVCSRTSKTKVLRTKRKALHKKFRTCESHCYHDDGIRPYIETDHNTFSQNMAVHLWQIMQTHLYEPKAARRLKPLHVDAARMDSDTELLFQLPLDSEDGTEYFDADEIEEESDGSNVLDDDSYYDDADFDDDFYEHVGDTNLFENDQLHDTDDCCSSDKDQLGEDEYHRYFQPSQTEAPEASMSWPWPTGRDHETRNNDCEFVEYSDDEVLSIGMAAVSMNEVDGTALSSLEQQDGAISFEEMLCH